MADLTILYYTCHRIAWGFARSVRRVLIESLPADCQIVVLSQNGSPHEELDISADFSNRIKVLLHIEALPSIAQVYRNILTGCYASDTPYCASAEDDTLYTDQHWTYRPPLDTFAYNEHRAVLTRKLSDDKRSRSALYYMRPRTQMAMGIFPRALMIDTLEEKFAKFPDPPLDTTMAKKAGWGEPGRYEKNLRLMPRKLERLKWTEHHNITVNHNKSLMGRRRVNSDDIVCEDLPPWGNAAELWNRIVG